MCKMSGILWDLGVAAPGTSAHACHLGTWKMGQEDGKFKARLVYMLSHTSLGYRGPVSKNLF